MSTPEGARLSPAARRAALAAATEGRHDVVVIGGGVTGAGVALDAASRGLSVVLLEAGDLASGTSSRSGKTAHGGLRYLEQLNFSLVAEALRERDLMIRTLAPHLVAPEPFLFPLTRHWERPYIGAGVALYDLMALAGRTGGRGGVPHHRHLTRRGALREAPGLDPAVVTGALQYYDGRMDDARHTLAVARTAAGYGAHLLSYARVTGLRRTGDRVTGVDAVDLTTGDRFGVSGRVVINAAGVWAADVQAMAGTASFRVTPAKGVHLVVAHDAFESDTGILARAEDSVIILRKWFGHWLLGTTDTAFHGDRASPTVDDEDIDYLLRNVNRYLARPLRRSQLLGAYAGLRPLLAAAPGRTGSTSAVTSAAVTSAAVTSAAVTSALSRDHTVLEEPAGLITVVGGKYTTYRVMARDAVNASARALGRTLPPSPTAALPLVGAAGWQVVANRLPRLATEYGIEETQLRRMLHRYGDELPTVLAPILDRPDLARPIPGTGSYLPVEFRYAASHEGAVRLVDVLTRRTRLAIEQPGGGAGAADGVAALIAPLLGWDETRQAREVAEYRDEPRLAVPG
ncbi:MAG TPA: glycerol-3-phosphate dehydrogenase/oxidase [Pseudonocardia sp.]|nr:glycerol-3-phosphate dehydrogenase/oxidase [Pseudonocardia sp.]